MKIRSACIRFKKLGSTEPYQYMENTSHCNCYDNLCMMGIYVRVNPEKFDVTEGFMCDDNRFVDRLEAMQIAKKYDLLKCGWKNTDEVSLKSYMIKMEG